MATLYDEWASNQANKKYLKSDMERAQEEDKANSKAARTSGLRGLLQSFIPTAGGAGGALGGAALGASLGSVVPGIGTAIGGLAGAVLGGAGGSALGKGVQNSLEGEEDLGKGVAEEALIGGLTSTPIGAGLKVARGAIKAGTGIGKTAAKQSFEEAGQKAIPKVFTDLQEQAGQNILKTSGAVGGGKPTTFVQNMGKRLTESGSGLKADPTVGGVGKLGEQSEFMSKYTGTPRQQRVAMEKDMGALSSQVDDILTKTPVKLDGSQVGQRLKQASTDLTDERFIDLDLTNPGVQKIVDRYSDKFSKAGGAKEVNDIVKTLNKTATRAQTKLGNPNAAPLTVQETAALALKRAGDDVLSGVPDIAPLKQQMAQIFDVTPQVARAGEKSIGMPMASGMDMKSPVQALKGAQSKIGSMLQGRGKKVDQESLSTAFNPPTPPPGTGQGMFGALARQGVGRMIAPETSQVPPEDAQITPEPMADELNAMQIPEQTDNSAQIKANLQQAAMQALAAGDTKGLDSIVKMAGLMESLNPSAASEKPLSAEASKVVANANSGLSSLAQLENVINKQGGVSAGTLVPGRELFGGAGAALLGTGEYDTAARNVKDVITRLRTGAALTDQEAAFYESQIPQAFDSPETRAQKTKIFRDMFQSVANRTGTAGTDIQSSLGV